MAAGASPALGTAAPAADPDHGASPSGPSGTTSKLPIGQTVTSTGVMADDCGGAGLRSSELNSPAQPGWPGLLALSRDIFGQREQAKELWAPCMQAGNVSCIARARSALATRTARFQHIHLGRRPARPKSTSQQTFLPHHVHPKFVRDAPMPRADCSDAPTPRADCSDEQLRFLQCSRIPCDLKVESVSFNNFSQVPKHAQ